MKIDDPFHILDQFNEACKDAADKAAHTVAQEFEIKLAVAIADIDDWWTIQIEDRDVKTRYADFLTHKTPEERQDFLSIGREEINHFPANKAHLNAARAASKVPLLIDMHYLPHFVEYMDDVFDAMEGYRYMQQILKDNTMSGRIAMRLVDDGPKDFENAGNPHGLCQYRLSLLAELEPPKGTKIRKPLNDRPKTLPNFARRLH